MNNETSSCISYEANVRIAVSDLRSAMQRLKGAISRLPKDDAREHKLAETWFIIEDMVKGLRTLEGEVK